MSLPPACPAASGTVVAVELKRCWARSEEYFAPAMQSCRTAPVDDFGLCRQHRRELLGGDRA